jgi:hypothetical protein
MPISKTQRNKDFIFQTDSKANQSFFDHYEMPSPLQKDSFKIQNRHLSPDQLKETFKQHEKVQ